MCFKNTLTSVFFTLSKYVLILITFGTKKTDNLECYVTGHYCTVNDRFITNNRGKIEEGSSCNSSSNNNNNSNNFDHSSIPQQNKDHSIYFSLLLLDDVVVVVAVVDVVAVVVVGPWEKEVGVIQLTQQSEYEIFSSIMITKTGGPPPVPFIHSDGSPVNMTYHTISTMNRSAF